MLEKNRINITANQTHSKSIQDYYWIQHRMQL